MSDLALCKLCIRQFSGEQQEIEIKELGENEYCPLCFGIIDDELIEQVAAEAARLLNEKPYDSSTFILALALPASQMLQFHPGQAVPEIYGYAMLGSVQAACHQLATGMSPTLTSELQMTITFENDEFADSDRNFIESTFPGDFQSRKRKQQNWAENGQPEMSKVQLIPYFGRLTEEQSKRYTIKKPSKKCTFSIAFEREPVYIAGRYCKYSRSLPQSPWSADEQILPIPGNSVTEKVCEILKREFQAESYRFVASGREDVDVRMLGTGRPFVVHLINCRRLLGLKWPHYIDRLKGLEAEINKQDGIRINQLTRVNRDEAESLSVGQEEKRKTYTAFCYSTKLITDDMLTNPMARIPLETIQKTPVRVMKRRSLLDRPRTIFTMETMRIDDFHFLLRVETQAGTYIKEFVHGDFGRTRPSMADLMGVDKGDEVDILELDVENVDLEWPPFYESPQKFK
ncbi:unnamed protein product, partial [Mesorhabditis spiculigera]